MLDLFRDRAGADHRFLNMTKIGHNEWQTKEMYLSPPRKEESISLGRMVLMQPYLLSIVI